MGPLWVQLESVSMLMVTGPRSFLSSTNGSLVRIVVILLGNSTNPIVSSEVCDW
jgi:hypothetical protein